MPRYETLFVLHPELPEAQVRETLDRVRRLIEGMAGQVSEIQDWGSGTSPIQSGNSRAARTYWPNTRRVRRL